MTTTHSRFMPIPNSALLKKHSESNSLHFAAHPCETRGWGMMGHGEQSVEVLGGWEQQFPSKPGASQTRIAASLNVVLRTHSVLLLSATLVLLQGFTTIRLTKLSAHALGHYLDAHQGLPKCRSCLNMFNSQWKDTLQFLRLLGA